MYYILYMEMAGGIRFFAIHSNRYNNNIKTEYEIYYYYYYGDCAIVFLFEQQWPATTAFVTYGSYTHAACALHNEIICIYDSHGHRRRRRREERLVDLLYL